MHDQKISEVMKQLHTTENGLSDEEAKKRLLNHGKNLLQKDKKKNPFIIFCNQLLDPLVYVLIAAFAISLLLKEYTDAMIIIFVILLNAVLSTIQECKAEKALASLIKLTSPTCLVKRNRQIKEIKAEELVVGDIEVLEAGRNVCADIRLIQSSHLTIDESSLTGESMPSEKDSDLVLEKGKTVGDMKNMAFMSSSVMNGSGEGIVVATGMNTQIGKIAKLLKEEKKTITPLQKKLNEISKWLAISTIFICILIFVIAILQQRDKLEMLITAISLAVAVIPEGLLAVVTIVLSLGVQKLSKVHTIVRKLHSVETLGCVNVICSDKTGTLTLNKMSVTKLVVNQHIYHDKAQEHDLKFLSLGLSACNDTVRNKDGFLGDPTEVALFAYGEKYHHEISKRTDCLPFDSNRKMMSTLHENHLQFSKGAIDSVLRRCNRQLWYGKVVELSNKDREKIMALHEELAKEGLRIIALAYQNTNVIQEQNMIFVGLAAMIDPPREEAKKAICTLKKAHIKTVMITGDHKSTAFAIARKLDLAHREQEIITGEELDRLSDGELRKKISQYSVFARVSPTNKVAIVKAFQAQHQIVAMTGDGVNDAPSLKRADIGIAMGITGTDVSKNASDMILMDDNFASIEKAVKEGRGIYNNIKKSLLFLLSSNAGEVLVMFMSILLNLPIPLLAIHILWVNLLTDTLPSLALGQDSVDDSVMEEMPRDANESIFAKKGLFIVLFYGFLIGLISFFSFLFVPAIELYKNNSAIDFSKIIYLLTTDKEILLKAQTYAFSTLALSQLFHSIGMRDVQKTAFCKQTLKNKLLLFALLIGIVIQFCVTEIQPLSVLFKTTRLSFAEWGIILLLSMLPLFAHEIKIIFKKRKK